MVILFDLDEEGGGTMARLESTYTVSGRAIYTDLNSNGSSLLGAIEGFASRASICIAVFQHVSVTPNLIDVTLKDGSKLYASGFFENAFETDSYATFLSKVAGTINQIVEIETISPNSPRYTLSDIAVSVQDYFSTATWEDVLRGGDTLIGGVGWDDLIDYGGHTVFKGMGGNDGLLAMESAGNLAIYQGKLADYQIALNQNLNIGEYQGLTGLVIQDSLSERDGRDMAVNIDRLQFSDINLALDTGKGEIAGSAYRIYKAAFDRTPDAGGLGFWINAMDDGASLTSVAAGFINSPEFQQLYGANVTDRDYVTKLYNNVLDRNPDQEGYDFWLGAMAKGLSREDVLVNFSESKENIGNVADLIANGIQYQEWIS